MGGFFSRSNRNKITNQDKAILDLKRQRDKIKMHKKRYDQNVDKEKDLARTYLKNGEKERALLCLKRKKYQETIICQMLGCLNKVESIIADLEMAQLNSDVVESVKNGNEALRILNERYSIEDVEKIMEDSREAQEHQENISSILVGNLTNEDLADIEEEYENILSEQLSNAEHVVNLPEVPNTPIEDQTKKQQIDKNKQKSKIAA